MRALLILLLMPLSSFAQESCPVPGSPHVPADLAAIWNRVNKTNTSCPAVVYRPNFGESKNVAEVQAKATELFKAMGLELQFETGSDRNSSWKGFSDSVPGDLEKLKRIADIAFQSFSVYPAGFFKKAGVTKLSLIRDLEVKDASGNATRRAAMPSPQTKTLYFAENGDMSFCPSGLEFRLHHELFHQIEGTVCSNMKESRDDWAKLNVEKKFDYAAGGQLAYKPGFNNIQHPDMGFVSEYAMFGQEEDRSETFAYMMSSGFADKFREWQSVDTVLKLKQDYITEFLKTKMGASEMTETYFSNRLSTPPSASKP